MALTAAERQRRYRERHLGIEGAKERMQLFLNVSASVKLKRLAHHDRYTVTKLLEVLATEAEERLLDGLTPQQQNEYLKWLPY